MTQFLLQAPKIVEAENAAGKQTRSLYTALGKSVALTVPKNPPKELNVSLTAEAS